MGWTRAGYTQSARDSQMTIERWLDGDEDWLSDGYSWSVSTMGAPAQRRSVSSTSRFEGI